MDILYVILVILVLLSSFYLGIIIKGPSLWDRLLGISLISAKVMIMITIVATVNQLSFMLDFALIFALTGFVGTIFVSIFVARREKLENTFRGKNNKRKGGR